MKRDSELPDKLVDQRGSVIVPVALLLVILLAVAGLALDIGYLMVVRNELQNAADASALAGAGLLFPGNPNPNWSAAGDEVTLRILPLNKANDVTPNCQVQTGYWNLTPPPGVLHSTPGANDVPAVMVTESVSCNLFFMPVLGINSQPVSALAVAALSNPLSAGRRTLLPFALPKPLYDLYWDSNGNKPKIDPNTGSAYVFDIGYIYHNPAEAAGQWTSFLVIDNSESYIQGLLDNFGARANPSTINIGDEIYIQSETPPPSLLYQAAKDFIGQTVFVPVVAQVVPGTTEPVVAFGALHIIDAVTDAVQKKQYIKGYFDYNVRILSGAPGGPNYGVYTPAVLVK
jgi:hypothetical protein